jgi:LPS-assembly lipoprotein
VSSLRLAAVRVAILALAIVGAGCGFHLQGSGTLPPALAKAYVRSPSPHSDFLASLTEALRLRGSDVVTAREQAEAVVDVTVDQTGQRVLSVTARNIPREYEVYYAVTFSLLVGQEKLIDSESLVVTRSYTYDETQVLAKASEEQILREALADDLARRVVRRIEALGATAALPPGAPPASPAPPTQP